MAVDRTAAVVSYAGYGSASGRLNLFLLNKGYEDLAVAIAIKAGNRYGSGTIYQWQGKGPDDANPVWSRKGSALVTGGNELERITFPATSLTVIELEIYRRASR